MKFDDVKEWDYCPKCDKHVHAIVECYSTIGQYGTNVYAKEYCNECNHLIRERLIEKDI